MKKFMIVAVALFISVSAAFAQSGTIAAKEKKSPEERAGKFTQRMTKELALDATQQERVKGINLERFKQLEEAKSVTTADTKETSTKVKQINENYFMNLKGVLTPEQFTRFQEMKEEMKEKAFQKKQGK
jgi:periplasmic protein CpxP/Spy